MKEKDFDISVRNILEGAEVPVSGKVWKGVAAAIAPKTFVIPSWAYALSGVAAAAAIALGVFLFRPNNTVSTYPGAIALAPAEVKTELIDAKVASPARRQLAQAAAPAQDVQETPEESGAADAQPAIQAPTPVKAGTPKSSVSEDNSAFNRLIFQETKARRPKFGLHASADLQGNTRGAFSRPGGYMAVIRAPQVPNGEGIYNAFPEVAFGLPFAVGVGGTYSISDRWSVGTGLRYTRLTRTFIGDYYDADEFPYLQTDIDNYQHWLGVPLNMYFDVLSSKYWHFHTFVGGTMEFLLDNDFLIHAPKDIHYHQSSGYPPQFSLGAGVGIEFMIMDNVGLYFDPSLRYYFATQKQPRSIRTVQPFRMDVEAGLRMYFGK